jgi:hypothetical protein
MEAAIPVARMRGEVMFFEQQPGSCFDFLVSGPAGNSAVRVDRALRIHGSIAGIAADYAGTIERISASALARGILREFWLWSPWGTMRFFRIDGTAILEIDRLGNVRAPLVKGALAGVVRPRCRKSKKKNADAAVLPDPAPEQNPGTAGVSQVPEGAEPAGKTVKEPTPVRYLRRRAAEMKRRKEEERAGAGPARNPGPEIPGATHDGDQDPPASGRGPDTGRSGDGTQDAGRDDESKKS